MSIADDGVARAVADDVQKLAPLQVFLQIGEELRAVDYLAAVEWREHDVLGSLRVVGERRARIRRRDGRGRRGCGG